MARRDPAVSEESLAYRLIAQAVRLAEGVRFIEECHLDGEESVLDQLQGFGFFSVHGEQRNAWEARRIEGE